MDNNFDKNNNVSEDNVSSDIPVQDNVFPHQNDAPFLESQQISPQQNVFPGQYGMPYYGQNIGAYPSPAKEPKKRRLSNEWLCALISVIVAMFVIIIVLMAAIAATTPKMKDNNIYQNQNVSITKVDNDPVDHVDIELPKAERPVLEDDMYRNKETGLLTTVGVAKMILPSQVKIKVFGEMPYAPVAYGSGVIITSNGYILTNAHVVDEASQFAVVFYDGSEAEAKIVGIDKKSDLAVIWVDRSDLSPAELGTSADLVIGEEIAVAGAGGGFENTVTYGYITGLDRMIDTNYISSSTLHCIQTDAALNPGNSGGALVNMYGQVIGIAVARDENYEGIGFSIAIDDAAPIAEDLIAYGYVTTRTQVGITYVSIGDASASAYGVMSGLCVMDIDPACDAVNADIMQYDIITEINGKRVFGSEEIAEALSEKMPGDTITLTVFRKSITGETSLFETKVVLSPDTRSVSGYPVSNTEQSYTDEDPTK